MDGKQFPLFLKARKIRLLGLDVDGILTDGTVLFGDQGLEIKGFNVKDGFGIRALLDHGIAVAIITGRSSAAVQRRADDLGIPHVYQGVGKKEVVFKQLLDQLKLDSSQAAFVGDDFPDLPVLMTVGLSVTVADAHPAVRSRVDLVTTLNGGCGAVREVADLILQAQGAYAPLLDAYLGA